MFEVLDPPILVTEEEGALECALDLSSPFTARTLFLAVTVNVGRVSIL